MRTHRAALIIAIVAVYACRGHPVTITEDAGPSAPKSKPEHVVRAPSRPAAIAPVPCATITRGTGVDALISGMRDLGMGMGGAGMHARGMGMGGAGMPWSRVLGGWPNLDVWLLGAELPGEPTSPEPPADDALRARGVALYDLHCAMCHGARGDGTGPLAAMLADRPPQDFTTGVYKLRTTPHGSLPTDADLFRTLSRGLHGTPMIPWTNLSERDRWALVSRLKTFSSDFTDEAPPTPIEIPRPPAETGALIARGAHLFQTAGCSSCHGSSGKGDGPGAALLRDANGRPVRPTDLTGYLYRRGALTKDIYITLRTGLDGTPMASFEHSLSSDDTWAIAAYVHSIAPQFIVTESGVACPRVANVDPWEMEGVRMAMMTMMPMGAMMHGGR